MNPKLHREIGHQRRLEILTALKRHGGMSVKEVAAHFGVSYMGVKQHCLDLERDGYLSTWRHAKGGMGRPELVYRLTRRAHELFPGASHPFTAEILEAVQQTYGPAAPTKLLFAVFAQRAESYRMQINHAPTLAERAEGLARLRDAEGYMAEFHVTEDTARSTKGLWIVEHHSPIEDILRRYPILARLEREMFERALNCPVQREEESGEAGYRCLFYLGAIAAGDGA